MNATEGIEAAGADHPRRLLRYAGDALWLLVAVVLGTLLWPSSLGGCTTLTIVSGESMEPTYFTGDLVVSRCGEVAVGDVIVYSPPDVGGARVIHRVIGGDAETGWVMQGDNNDFIDPWQPQGEQVLGSAVLHLAGVGRFASILLSPMTWISLLLIALGIVLWPAKPEVDATGTDGGTADDEEDPGRRVDGGAETTVRPAAVETDDPPDVDPAAVRSAAPTTSPPDSQGSR